LIARDLSPIARNLSLIGRDLSPIARNLSSI
jgi:hypothetical protein